MADQLADRPGPVTLIALRHGRTGWNVAGRFQGHGNPPLDPVGRAQAVHAAGDIAAFVRPRRPPLVAVVASDLRRASQTADVVGDHLGVAVRTDAALREVYLGGWEGLTREEAAARFPTEWAAWSAGRDVRRGQGETEEEAGRRAVAVIRRELRRVPAGGVLVVVGHGLSLRAALGQLGAGGRFSGASGTWAGSPPHLGNGCWTAVTVSSPVVASNAPAGAPA